MLTLSEVVKTSVLGKQRNNKDENNVNRKLKLKRQQGMPALNALIKKNVKMIMSGWLPAHHPPTHTNWTLPDTDEN